MPVQYELKPLLPAQSVNDENAAPTKSLENGSSQQGRRTRQHALRPLNEQISSTNIQFTGSSLVTTSTNHPAKIARLGDIQSPTVGTCQNVVTSNGIQAINQQSSFQSPPTTLLTGRPTNQSITAAPYAAPSGTTNNPVTSSSCANTSTNGLTQPPSILQSSSQSPANSLIPTAASPSAHLQQPIRQIVILGPVNAGNNIQLSQLIIPVCGSSSSTPNSLVAAASTTTSQGLVQICNPAVGSSSQGNVVVGNGGSSGGSSQVVASSTLMNRPSLFDQFGKTNNVQSQIVLEKPTRGRPLTTDSEVGPPVIIHMRHSSSISDNPPTPTRPSLSHLLTNQPSLTLAFAYLVDEQRRRQSANDSEQQYNDLQLDKALGESLISAGSGDQLMINWTSFEAQLGAMIRMVNHLSCRPGDNFASAKAASSSSTNNLVSCNRLTFSFDALMDVSNNILTTLSSGLGLKTSPLRRLFNCQQMSTEFKQIVQRKLGSPDGGVLTSITSIELFIILYSFMQPSIPNFSTLSDSDAAHLLGSAFLPFTVLYLIKEHLSTSPRPTIPSLYSLLLWLRHVDLDKSTPTLAIGSMSHASNLINLIGQAAKMADLFGFDSTSYGLLTALLFYQPIDPSLEQEAVVISAYNASLLLVDWYCIYRRIGGSSTSVNEDRNCHGNNNNLQYHNIGAYLTMTHLVKCICRSLTSQDACPTSS